MSYIRTNWVDNTTPIDKTNLNKIEQGIYNNSLVVDAVTNKLNPKDTETYKTAELTEGQITDVIGVNDIVIKGQTSQDGTPTPSAPIDINVVSGNNVIEIKSKNLININTLSNGYILGTGDISTQSTNEEMYSEFIKVKPNTAYTFKIFETTWSGFNSSNWIGIGEYSSIRNPIRNGFVQRDVMGIGTQNYYTITTTANTNYIIVSARGLVSATKIQLEIGSTATDYTPYYQGKELPLDLPVENLSPISSMSTINGGYINTSTGNLGSVIAGKTYTLSFKNNSSYTANIALRIIYDNTYSTETSANLVANGLITYTFTASHSGTVALSGKVEQDVTNIFTQLQLEQGSKANTYTPYGTEPIELCKIGNYQDYFYKSGSKWYLHKGIGKIVLDGITPGKRLISKHPSITSETKGFYQFNIADKIAGTVGATNLGISNYFKFVGSNAQSAFNNNSSGIWWENTIACYLILEETTLADANNWLATHNTTIYYVLATATDTEITDTTLISQLEAIYNAPLYEQTNITQINNDLPMILNITACKDNINGIKAFIRK